MSDLFLNIKKYEACAYKKTDQVIENGVQLMQTLRWTDGIFKIIFHDGILATIEIDSKKVDSVIKRVCQQSGDCLEISREE